MRVWVSKQLDFSGRDWAAAVAGCFRPGGAAASRDIESFWAPRGDGIVGLSVRSLFDLYLRAMVWERGDRIVFTALTVGDMPRIAREHGLEVVAVDIDPATTAPRLEALEALMTPRTRAVVFTHLYGARLDVSEAMAVAQRSGVMFIEDCAEAYAGPSWRGHEESDLALFSFGPIKTATAFGGGLARVSDPVVLRTMRDLSSRYPVQSRWEFFRKSVLFGFLKMMSTPWIFGLVVRALAVTGVGHDRLAQRLTRGFPGPRFFRRIRRRPSPPLLRLLRRRLQQGESGLERRAEAGRRLIAGLAGVSVPAGSARNHHYWLVPVLSRDPEALVDRLLKAGFDGTRGRAFAVVQSDERAEAPGTPGARVLMNEAVYLPFSPDMPGSVLDRLAALVRSELVGESASPNSEARGCPGS